MPSIHKYKFMNLSKNHNGSVCDTIKPFIFFFSFIVTCRVFWVKGFSFNFSIEKQIVFQNCCWVTHSKD